MALTKTTTVNVHIEAKGPSIALAALEIPQFETRSVPVKDAYIRVEEVTSTKSAGIATVHIYTADKSELIGKDGFEFAVSVGAGSPNFIQQAYEHMKRLPKYAEAKDA